MGTANSMQCATESLGLSLPGSASAPAVSAEKNRFAELTGRRIVGLIEENIKVSDIITLKAIRNCITVLMASGGSTNLLIHLTAIARRAGIKLSLDEFQNISSKTPLLVNVKPAGDYTVGVEFHQAGGVQALMKELEGKLDLSAMTVTGKTLGENLENARGSSNHSAIASQSKPISGDGGIAVLHGNLAPRGAVVKRSAASPELMKFRGEARVFDTLAEAEEYLLDEDSDMDETKAVILRGYGPKGAPGMPEFGNYLPIPPKMFKRGVKDYVRITDARMSGGAFGTVVLHVCPEALAGGPLGAVRNGDMINLDVEAGKLEVELFPEEIARRLEDTNFQPKEKFERGFVKHFVDSVLQADEGCDMDYL
jgi:dihydroxy-acid dehydratase